MPASRGRRPRLQHQFMCRNFRNRRIWATKQVDQVEELLRLRAIIGQAIEQARQEKLIGNTSKPEWF